MAITINAEYLTQILVDLVQINSINPILSPSEPGEAQIGAYLAEALKALGFETQVHELTPGRVNTVGVLRGRGGGRSLMWNAHMDTVGVQGMQDPFSGRIQDGKLYGRGSQDMKGGLAAMLAAARALQDAQIALDGDLIIAGVADEEYASLGSDDLVKHYHADAAIVTEPTDLMLGLAHRGFIWYEVETLGRAAHGSRYTEGIDAIMHMGRFLAGLEALGQELIHRPPHPLVGPPSLHASIISGGVEVSTYPAHCCLQVERRTCPGETVEQASGELNAIVERLSSNDPAFHANLRVMMARPPFSIGAQARIVEAVEQAAHHQLGRSLVHHGATFWTDAAILAEAGMETVLLGAVGGGLHSVEEWVGLQSVNDLAALLAETALVYCRS